MKKKFVPSQRVVQIFLRDAEKLPVQTLSSFMKEMGLRAITLEKLNYGKGRVLLAAGPHTNRIFHIDN